MSRKRYIRVVDFMRIYHIGRTKAYALTKMADFPCTRIGARILIDKEKLESEWIPMHENKVRP